MSENEWLTAQFETYRSHLRAVAYRMLGSMSEADDAVQVSWLRLSRADTSSIENLGGWLTTVVARVCLDMLRSRKSRGEALLEDERFETELTTDHSIDPEHEATLSDSVGLAMLIVLESLTPDERLAFVLHDVFAMPFVEIASIVGCSAEAARQLASRARRRVQSTEARGDVDPARQREMVEAFLVASRTGDFDALLALLHPDVVFRPDDAAIASGPFRETQSAAEVAKAFKGRARGVQLALINGLAGAIWASEGQVRGAFNFKVEADKIVEIELVVDAARLEQFDIIIEG
jgi:RNA polymerase sigma factor (sigma-70 family)